MEPLSNFLESLKLILTSNEIWEIAGLSITISVTAVLLSTLIGIPIALAMNDENYRGKTIITILINTGMGAPPVLVGLIVFLSFTRSGPLGGIRILFTPMIMIIAQFILTLPIIIGVTRSTLSEIPAEFNNTLRSLGANDEQIKFQFLLEGRVGILTGITLALGRAFSEVGAIIIVGGNIRYHTRVLTTAIITEISKGEQEMALALGILLMSISFTLVSILTMLQLKSK